MLLYLCLDCDHTQIEYHRCRQCGSEAMTNDRTLIRGTLDRREELRQKDARDEQALRERGVDTTYA